MINPVGFLRGTALPILGATVLLAGCGPYVPDGSTVVKVNNANYEFDRADLFEDNELGGRKVYRMKWYDTNTFTTTATLDAKQYEFRARSYDGAAMSRMIQVVEGQNLYEIDASQKGKDRAEAEQGPVVSGRVTGIVQGSRLPSVSVLFIGNQVVMRSTEVKRDGSFEVAAPGRGPWKIQVHLLGPQPRSYMHPLVNVQGALDLGTITLSP